MSRPEDSVIDNQQSKFLFPPGSTIDPLEIVKIFDHASEKYLFTTSLQERIPNAQRRNFILDIIDRVRNHNHHQQLPENLHQNFITVALPEILQSIPPANLRRQGIQHFGVSTSRKEEEDNDENQGGALLLLRGAPTTTSARVATSLSSSSPSTLNSNKVNNPFAGLHDCAKSETCVAKRIFITGKNGATNILLLRYLGITHFVKCCELMPKHNSIDFMKDIIGSFKKEQKINIVNNNGGDGENNNKIEEETILLDVGMKDDDQSVDFSKNFDRVVEFVKSKLRTNKKNKILIFCQAGKHRSAWCSAAVLAALSRDREFCCPCLSERTRYHSSLTYSVAYSIVKQCRNFTDFSPVAEEQISKWIKEKKLKSFVCSSEEEDSDEKKTEE